VEESRAHRTLRGQAVLTTIEKRLVLKKLGELQPADIRSLRASLTQILG
jgi:hypothetical protein